MNELLQEDGKMTDEEEKKIPLVPMGSKESVIDLNEARLKNPFQETHFTDNDFYHTVCERYEKVN